MSETITLIYLGDGPGQASRIQIDGETYDRADPPFEVELEKGIRLLVIGGFYEIEKQTEAPASPEEEE